MLTLVYAIATVAAILLSFVVVYFLVRFASYGYFRSKKEFMEWYYKDGKPNDRRITDRRKENKNVCI